MAAVHFPAGLPDGPYPIVLFMHGNHSSCYRGDRAGYRWPCRRGWRPIPNYEGYDYAASRLASYGYVVVSVSANGVNVLGNRVPDTGMRQRGELLEEHLDLWQAWSTTGGAPFDDRFVGEVDMSTIGTMGHSRGGEGVVWHVIVDRERDDPYGIDAVMPLAPVDFTRETVNRVELAVVLPYCDGDVFDLQGVHFFDDARYRVAGDPRAKHTLTLMGANHNFFNSVWTPSSGFPGSFDDAFGRCEGKLTAPQQRKIGATYITSYFRRYLGDETDLDPVWTGETTPPGIDRDEGPDGLPRARSARSSARRGSVHGRAVDRADRGRGPGDGHGPVAAQLVPQHVRDAMRAGRSILHRCAPARPLARHLRVVGTGRTGSFRARGRGPTSVRSTPCSSASP